MKKAQRCTKTENWSGAAKIYRTALGEFPNDVEAMNGLAHMYMRLNQYETSIRIFQRVLRNDPSNIEVISQMGEALEKTDRPSEAIKAYLRAGSLYTKSGNTDEAVKIFEKVIVLDSEQVLAHNSLAQIYVRQGKTEEAVSELVRLAIIYQERGDDDKSGQQIRGASQLAPGDRRVKAAFKAWDNGVSIAASQMNIAHLSVIEEEINPAEEEGLNDLWDELTASALEDDYGNPREETVQVALGELANILFEDDEGNYGETSMNKFQIGTLVSQALDMQTQGQNDESIAVLNQIIDSGYKRPAISFVVANLHISQKHYDESEPFLTLCLQDERYAVGAHFALGEIFQAKGEPELALQHFVNVLRVIDLKNTTNENADELMQLYDSLVSRYIKESDSKETMSFVQSLINFLSSQDCERKIAEARDRLGGSVTALVEFFEVPKSEIVLSSMYETGTLLKRNMFVTATEKCFIAIQEIPAYLPLHMRLAEIYMAQDNIEDCIGKYMVVAKVYNIRGNLTQSISIYQKVLEISPMDFTVRKNLIDLHLRQGGVDSALNQFKILAEGYYQSAQVERSIQKYKSALKHTDKSTEPRKWRREILHRLGDIYNQRIEWESAIIVYEELVQDFPKDDKALLNLSELYFKLGNSTHGINTLNQLITLYIKQNNKKGALEILQQQAEMMPQEIALQEKLGLFYEEMGMKKEAIAQYDILGELQLDAGLPDDAALTIQRIIDIKPGDVSSYKVLLDQIMGGIY